MVVLVTVLSLWGCSDASTSQGLGGETGRAQGTDGDAVSSRAEPSDVSKEDATGTPERPDTQEALVADATQLEDSEAGRGHDSASDAGEVIDDAPSEGDTFDAADSAPAPVDVSDAQGEIIEGPQDADVASEDATMEVDGAASADALLSADVDDAVEASDAAQDLPESDVTDAAPIEDTGDVVSAEDTSEVTGDVDDVAIDASEPDAEQAPPAPLYLLSINNTTHTLEKIDVETGVGTDLCELNTGTGYPSLTFSRDNVLFASRGGTALDVIDPCTCQITPVASYGGYSGVNGITSDQGLNLFGVASTQDEFITISTSLGVAQSVGPLGVDFGSAGATWSEEEQTVYAINASTDALYEVEPSTGFASLIAPLSMPFGTVGIEMHPSNGVLYACSSAATLLQIDTQTGEVTSIGQTGQEGPCTNLAAPWKVVPCLE